MRSSLNHRHYHDDYRVRVSESHYGRIYISNRYSFIVVDSSKKNEFLMEFSLLDGDRYFGVNYFEVDDGSEDLIVLYLAGVNRIVKCEIDLKLVGTSVDVLSISKWNLPQKCKGISLNSVESQLLACCGSEIFTINTMNGTITQKIPIMNGRNARSRAFNA